MKTIGPSIVLASVIMLGVACSDEEPEAEQTSGGENALDTAERNVNEAQQEFQEEFQEEREFVDEKANKAADEGRKGVNKSADAVSDEDEEPEPGKP